MKYLKFSFIIFAMSTVFMISCTKEENITEDQELFKPLTEEELLSKLAELSDEDIISVDGSSNKKSRCGSGTRVQFFEGNNITQDDLECVNFSSSRNGAWNFRSCDGGRPFGQRIQNDEARSARFWNIPVGGRVILFDSGCPRPDNDDWVEIIATANNTSFDVGTFERSRWGNGFRVIYHRDNGLDGKVSSMAYIAP